MKMLNAFLSKMKLTSDDDDYEEDDFIEEEDDFDEEEEAPAKPVKAKPAKKAAKYIEEDEEEDDIPYAKTRSANKAPLSRPVSTKQSNKVIRYNRNNAMEVCVIKPNNIEDGREISDTLLDGKAVVLNLEGIDVALAQRVVDFTSGACYSIHGNLQKISKYIFIVTPESVDISGDFQELISSGDYSFQSENFY